MKQPLDDNLQVATSHSPERVPVTRSIISPHGLLNVLKARYSLGALTQFRFLKFAANDTYLLSTSEAQYVARVYGIRWRSQSEIQYELELLRHLHARGVAVAAPIPCNDGSLACPVSAPEGIRQLALFQFVQGTTLSWEQVQDWELAGQWAAEFHDASEDFTSQWTRPRLDMQYLIDAPLQAIRPFLTRRLDFRDYLEQFAGRLRTRLKAAVNAGLDWGVCHGDFEAKNIQITDDHKPTVLDFDLCGAGWRMYDFAAIYMNAKRDQSENIWTAFLRGYTARRRLAAADLAAVPLFPPLQCLSALRMFAQNANDWGSINIADGNLDYWEKYLSNWEKEHP